MEAEVTGFAPVGGFGVKAKGVLDQARSVEREGVWGFVLYPSLWIYFLVLRRDRSGAGVIAQESAG